MPTNKDRPSKNPFLFTDDDRPSKNLFLHSEDDRSVSNPFEPDKITPEEIRQKAKAALEKPKAESKSGETLLKAGGLLLGGMLLKSILSDSQKQFRPSSVSTARAIGESIRLRRADLALTQAQLAEKAGTAPRIISEIERGKETAEIGKVLDLLDALGLEMRLVAKG